VARGRASTPIPSGDGRTQAARIPRPVCAVHARAAGQAVPPRTVHRPHLAPGYSRRGLADRPEGTHARGAGVGTSTALAGALHGHLLH